MSDFICTICKQNLICPNCFSNSKDQLLEDFKILSSIQLRKYFPDTKISYTEEVAEKIAEKILAVLIKRHKPK